jgi:hypothetical protein
MNPAMVLVILPEPILVDVVRPIATFDARRSNRPLIRDRFVLLDGSAHEAQLDFGDPGRNVDAGLLLNRERLQFDRAERAAD